MKVFNKFAVLTAAVVFVFVGCGKKTDRTEKKLGPAETVTHFASSVSNAQGFQLWAALPKSWRADINGIANKIGAKMPAELWDKAFEVLGRIGKLIKDRSAVMADMMASAGPGVDKADAKKSMTDLGAFLISIAKSDIATVASLKSVDLADVADEHGTKLLEMLTGSKALSKVMGESSKGKFSTLKEAMALVKSEKISATEDTAKLKVTDPEGNVNEVAFVKVEGKWLPEEMVKEYKKNISRAKKELDKMLEQAKKAAPQAGMAFAMAEGFIVGLESAKSDEEFKKAIGSSPINPLAMLGALGNARGKAKMAKSKSHLKQMGTTVAMHFSDGVQVNFPADYKKLDFDKEIFVHPKTNKVVSLDEIFKGNGEYIPVYKVGAAYSGSSTKALFIEKPGLWEDGTVNVVYEDGHVAPINASSMTQVKSILNIK